MKFIAIVSGIAMATALGFAHAQAYKWVDKDGKTRYGDTPPPGVKAVPMKAPAAPPTPAPTSKEADKADAKPAAKGPLTPAEQAQAFRERQAKAKEEAAKTEKERAEANSTRQNCDRALAAMRTLESGQRIAQVTPSGERVFIDDKQREVQLAAAQKDVSNWCK